MTNAAVLHDRNPGADPPLVDLLMANFDDAVDWIRKTGAEVRDRLDLDTVMGFPSHGHLFDNIGYLERCKRSVINRGSDIIFNTAVDSLTFSNGAVTGAVITDADSTATIAADTVILATGGLQGSPELRRKYIGASADAIILRANPHSTGDGLRLALSAGAGTSTRMDGFYGHLVPSPLVKGLDPADYARLSMMFSPKCILVDSTGHRWMDESRGYFVNAQEVARVEGQRALLIGDQTVRDEDGLSFGNSEQSDRIITAGERGARVVVDHSLERIDSVAAEWGYPGVRAAVQEFNTALETQEAPSVPRERSLRPVRKPPYFAVEVQPTITFSHGGVRVDDKCRVLRSDGSPIVGLSAAGVDIGGFFDGGYGGGLAMSTVTGLKPAETAVS